MVRLLTIFLQSLTLLMIFTGLTANAAFACSGQIVSSSNPSADYKPFDPVDNLRSYAVTIENRSDEDLLSGCVSTSPQAPEDDGLAVDRGEQLVLPFHAHTRAGAQDDGV